MFKIDAKQLGNFCTKNTKFESLGHEKLKLYKNTNVYKKTRCTKYDKIFKEHS